MADANTADHGRISLLERRRALQFIAGGLATGVPIARAQPAAGFTLKVGNDVPDSHPLTIRMKQAAADIREDTAGDVDVQIFSHNVLGGDTDMLAQLRSGALEMMTLSGNILSTLVPAASISGVAFALPTYDVVWKAMDGDLGGFVRKALEKVGLVALDKVWDNGFREITSSTHPIVTPDDLRGFKIRVPVSPMWISTFRSLGAAPVSLNSAEMYSALQTHVMDGQENSLVIIDTFKMYEVQKYVSMTRHVWEGFFMLANAKVWRGLPDKYRQCVADRFNQAAIQERADLALAEQSLQPALTGQGMVFNTTDAAAFREVLARAGYYAKWRDAFGMEAWRLLETYAGPLV